VQDAVVEIPLTGQPLACDTLSAGTQMTSLPVAVDGFIAGPENALVAVAVQSLLDPAAEAFSPVVFFGPPGLGKSHLALGLVTAWKAQFPRQPALLTTAVDFARHLAEAIETKTDDDFAEPYRQASLLVIEDVEHLATKPAAQQELIHLLDSLGATSARVVLTACTAPTQLPGLLPALQSRLLAGLTVPLAPPGRSARLAIVKQLARQRAVDLPPAIIGLLADELTGSVPELLGALMHLEMTAQVELSSIDASLVRRCLAQRRTTGQPTVRDIALLTARHFSLRLGDLRSATRRRTVVTARAVAMYLARTCTSSSLEEIGRFFGGRDHTTVAHGCRKTEELIAIEPSIREAVQQLQEQL